MRYCVCSFALYSLIHSFLFIILSILSQNQFRANQNFVSTITEVEFS